MICKILIQAATVNKETRPNQDNLMADKYIKKVSELEFFSSSFITDNSETRLCAVADGVGGEASGEAASDMVVKVLCDSIGEIKNSGNIKETLKSVTDRVNLEVVKLSGGYEISASTLSGIVLEERKATAFYVGDSPIYYIHNSELKRLDNAHTVANEKKSEAMGKTTRDENIITKYMGNRNETGREQVSFCEVDLSVGDMFIICSDGVEKGLSEKHLKKLALKKRENTAELIVKKAYKTAKVGGRADDTTAILIKILG